MKLPHLLHIHFEEFDSDEKRKILKEYKSAIVSNLFHDINLKLEKDFINKQDLIVISLSQSYFSNGKTILQELISEKKTKPILIITENLSSTQISELLRIGANDFIAHPFNQITLQAKINMLLESNDYQNSLLYRAKELLGLINIIGKSESFVSEIEKLPIFAKCDSCVLVAGETGTGKEMIARSIHYLSQRANKPFVPINCGAIPADLIENELFGHKKGAFTGASTLQRGLIQEADQGTLFLDEIDSLPLFSQVKLLRFLQDKEFRPLGSAKTQKADVRIIAASNSNLEDLIELGKLRMDLYYRLNVLQVLLPPLRNRIDDIPLLAQHFVEKYAVEFDKNVYSIDNLAIQKLQSYPWRGNVRELENVIERAVLLTQNTIITDSDINPGGTRKEKYRENFQVAKARVIATFEKSYLQKILSAYHGNISQAAKAAGKNRRAFFELIRKYEIKAENFRFDK